MGEVTFLGCDQDAYCASVARHVHEFEESSGHTVHVRLIDNDEYFANDLDAYLGGDSPADVYVSGPVLVWEQLGKGFVEPLDPFLDRASDYYDPDDFLPSLLKCNRWSGQFGDPLGFGPLLEIPVNCESYNLAYVPETLERAGVEVPRSWPEYLTSARQIATTAAPVRGFAQRGGTAWHTIYTGFATQFWSYGARDFDEHGRCSIASPDAVQVTTEFVAALREAGPEDWLNQRWYELAVDFANGKYGMIVDSDHYVAYFEDPTISPLRGKIGYAMPPAGPDGGRKSNLWSWSAVMNPRSRAKDTAWQFMEWATGPQHLLRSAVEGNMNPTRRSTWNDAGFQERAATWGDFASVSRHLVEQAAEVLVTPATNYIQIARRWTRALRDAYAGPESIEACLDAAAADIDELTAST